MTQSVSTRIAWTRYRRTRVWKPRPVARFPDTVGPAAGWRAEWVGHQFIGQHVPGKPSTATASRSAVPLFDSYEQHVKRLRDAAQRRAAC
jgi:hypothetical protein